MIPRYTRPVMAAIWAPENRFRIWLQVELAACEAWNRLGRIPDEALSVIREKADFDIGRIEEIELEVKHDVIAFLSSVAEKVGPDSRYIHMGMTSSDVLDTSLGVQLVQAADLLLNGIERARDAVREKALAHRDTVMMGRSHGMHAEPTTFGLKMAVWFEELGRAAGRVRRARETVAVGKLSGAVGTYSNIPPDIEEYVCADLGLIPARVATQVIQRDRHAEYMTALSLTASSLEKFAVEIRHLMRTEVGEVQEAFTEGQKGSSAMPHKKNPILSENLSGLARLIRGYCLSAMENIPLWHERDISHSSVERVIFPDATIVVDFMLHRFASLVEGLVIDEKRMLHNMELSGGTTFSQTLLLALVERGMTREDSYAVVQRNAHKAMDS
ncbi:MAG: adenylosuccinate lyase, partial [Pseudomonadota bacterium]